MCWAQAHDTHYQCYARYTQHPEKFKRQNVLRDRRFGTPFVALKARAPYEPSCCDNPHHMSKLGFAEAKAMHGAFRCEGLASAAQGHQQSAFCLSTVLN